MLRGKGNLPSLGRVKVIENPAPFHDRNIVDPDTREHFFDKFRSSDPGRDRKFQFLAIDLPKAALPPHRDRERNHEDQNENLHIATVPPDA